MVRKPRPKTGESHKIYNFAQWYIPARDRSVKEMNIYEKCAEIIMLVFQPKYLGICKDSSETKGIPLKFSAIDFSIRSDRNISLNIT